MIRPCLALSMTILMVGCINKFEAADTEAEIIELEYNITIERLHQVLDRYSYYDVSQELVTCGYVTATDEAGNFYHSFVMEHAGYGIEILEGLSDSHVRHEEGSRMVVNLEGLRLSRSRGVLQVGLPASDNSYYTLDYLAYEVIIDEHITNTGVVEYVTPRPTTLAELEDETLLEELAGALVTISGVELVSDEDVAEATVWSGTVEFADSEERTLSCYTSSYSNFSMCEIPSGMLSLTGILQTEDGSTEIKLRSEDDCVVID